MDGCARIAAGDGDAGGCAGAAEAEGDIQVTFSPFGQASRCPIWAMLSASAPASYVAPPKDSGRAPAPVLPAAGDTDCACTAPAALNALPALLCGPMSCAHACAASYAQLR